MAMQTVPHARPTPWMLPSDKVTRADELISYIDAIVNLMACASISEQQPNEDSIPMAAFVVRDMGKELREITGLRVHLEGEG